MSRRFGEEGRQLSYGTYLKVPELLTLQRVLSSPPHHDELQFIVVHQTWLIISGNFAWLNWLTLSLAVVAVSDAQLGWLPITRPALVAQDLLSLGQLVVTHLQAQAG